MTTTANLTLDLVAHSVAHYHPGVGEAKSTYTFGGPQDFMFRSADFETEAEAQAFVALLPKYVGLRVVRCSHSGDRSSYSAQTRSSNLNPDGVNGGVNETAIARYRKSLKAAAKAGIEITCIHGEREAVNRYESIEAFEAAIA